VQKGKIGSEVVSGSVYWLCAGVDGETLCRKAK